MSGDATIVFPRNEKGGISEHPSECTCGRCERARSFDACPFRVGERVEAPEYATPGSVATVRGYEDGTGKVLIEWDEYPGAKPNYWPSHLRRVGGHGGDQ